MRPVVPPATLLLSIAGMLWFPTLSAESQQEATNMVVLLDGEWLLATDPDNTGREDRWWEKPAVDARPTRVPWIIQDAFPGYHGVAWYWRELQAPANPHPEGRTLLRFWAVDYLAEVWLNDMHIGRHEGGETPFLLDVTDVIRTDIPNRLAVRVLNPTNEPIDGIVLRQTPARNKVIPYSAGSSYNHGGIVDSVELVLAPQVRIADLFLRPDPETGVIRVRAEVRNAGDEAVAGRMSFAIAAAAGGETLATTSAEHVLAPGDNVVEAELRVDNPRLWELADPYLYRVTARVQTDAMAGFDECSARCGFRELRFDDGAFRLNGRRIYLRCSHTGNHCPIGLQLPPDPDMLRRDLLNVKVMGFNTIRFIAGVATRTQLDLCDEIGLMVYEEPYAAWCLADSPAMKERYDRSVAEMIRRDRNHPSIAIWGLLNETPDGPVFRNAVAALPWVRALDETRMVMLNSGRWDNQVGSTLTGLLLWRTEGDPDPNVSRNPEDHALTGLGITWRPGQVALHPGPKGEYSVVRWTTPVEGDYEIAASFVGISQHATTDVHILVDGRSVFDDLINLDGRPNQTAYEGKLVLEAGDTVDCVVGWGNADYGADTTALVFRVRSPQGEHDAAVEFAASAQPAGPWSYGRLAPGQKPDSATFEPYPVAETLGQSNGIGTLSNPGSAVWEDVLSDQHPYQRVPHTASVINFLRTVSGGANPLFISEYGVGSAVDLCRTVRHYERLGKEDVEDARFYRDKLDRFLVDFERWGMGDCFDQAEDFFLASQRSMARDRLLGLNALRANPNVVGHSLTGTVDQGMSGEGLFTTFRELKPGTVDAMFQAWAPLRLCLFASPVNAYRGAAVHLEAVLANEDALRPGEYPVRIQVVGPDMTRHLDRTVMVSIPQPRPGVEPPFAFPIFSEDVVLDGPEGEYRFVAAFQRGGAAAGGEASVFIADTARMPTVSGEVCLWGDDPKLTEWLTQHGIRTRAFSADMSTEGETILVGNGAPDDEGAWEQLTARVEAGATAVFLCPEVFSSGEDPVAHLPLTNKGSITALMGWLYHKDEWNKRHPIFEGLPAGGLMDHALYGELIPDLAFCGLDAPAETVAGACNASFDYSAGLLTAVYPMGKGRLILNTLLIRENLGPNPVAERLLRNMLRYAGGAL